MTKQEADSIALENFPIWEVESQNGYGVVDLNLPERRAFVKGLLAGFEAGVREAAKGAQIMKDDGLGIEKEYGASFLCGFTIYAIDQDSILSLLNEKKE